jgi:hypothetical protein
MWETKTTYRSSWTYDYNRRPSDDEGKQVEVRRIAQRYESVPFGAELVTEYEDREGRRYVERRFSPNEGHASYGSFLPA